jgi:two-component system sensor histidine kinase TctE
MMDKWRFSSNSLGRRLLLQLLLVAAVLSALLYLAVRSVANQAAIAAHDNILGASATAIAEQLSASDGEVLIDIPYSAFSMLGTISEDRVFYRIDSNRETITGYEDLPLPKDIAVRTAPHYYSARFRDSAIRAVAMERLITVNTLVIYSILLSLRGAFRALAICSILAVIARSFSRRGNLLLPAVIARHEAICLIKPP